MKKSDRIARDLEQSVSTAVENAKDWAAPRVEAAVDWAVPRLQQGLDTASPKIQEGLKSAAHNLADGVATVTPRIQDGLAQLAPKIHDAVESATPRLHEALDKATPVIANARDRVVVEYLPKLSDQIGHASDAVHRTLEGAPAHVDAVAQRLVDSGVVHNIQEQAQSAGQQLKAAAAEASRVVTGEVAKPQKPKHRGFLIFGVIAAAVAAGVAAWKASKPIEDPWKTPSPVTPATPAPVPATTVSDVKETVKEKRQRRRGHRCRRHGGRSRQGGRCLGRRRRRRQVGGLQGCHRRQDRGAEHRREHERRGQGQVAPGQPANQPAAERCTSRRGPATGGVPSFALPLPVPGCPSTGRRNGAGAKFGGMSPDRSSVDAPHDAALPPAVSIVIPAYNEESVIRQCLIAAVYQSVPAARDHRGGQHVQGPHRGDRPPDAAGIPGKSDHPAQPGHGPGPHPHPELRPRPRHRRCPGPDRRRLRAGTGLGGAGPDRPSRTRQCRPPPARWCTTTCRCAASASRPTTRCAS